MIDMFLYEVIFLNHKQNTCTCITDMTYAQRNKKQLPTHDASTYFGHENDLHYCYLSIFNRVINIFQMKFIMF